MYLLDSLAAKIKIIKLCVRLMYLLEVLFPHFVWFVLLSTTESLTIVTPDILEHIEWPWLAYNPWSFYVNLPTAGIATIVGYKIRMVEMR